MAELTFLPDYAFFTLRDADADAAVDSAAALARARRDTVAGTGYEIYICCAQDLIPVHASIDTGQPPTAISWTHSGRLELHCPSGLLRLGDVTGTAISYSPPPGAGHYSVGVHHHGREAAVERIRELTGFHQKHGLDAYFSALQDSAGTERYHLRLQLNDRTNSTRPRQATSDDIPTKRPPDQAQ